MVEPVYTVERCCGPEVLDTTTICGVPSGQPRRALWWVMPELARHVPVNQEEDWFRVVDPAEAEWFYGYRDGKLVRLLRPPVSPGSLPPSP